jgi:hypothetical protein
MKGLAKMPKMSKELIEAAMPRWYVLNADHSVSPAPSDKESRLEYYDAFEKGGNDRRVAFDNIGKVDISTVFLGLDHSFTGGTPVLFETLVFGGPNDGYMERYCTWDEALAGHARILAEQPSGLTREQLEAGKDEILRLMGGDEEENG